ncbi:MAG TPA: primosomal protein N', partial [Chloroflexi bacterium]|nr:primosomal protein N' [Chloroflexota bacterium]
LEAVRAQSDAPLRALLARGWLSVADGDGESVQAGAVCLAVPPARVPGLLTEMRGTQTHLTVLEFLARNPTEMTVGEVYAATGAMLRHLEALAAEGLILITEREVTRNPLAGRVFAPDEPPVLTDEQSEAWREIEVSLNVDRRGPGEVFLIHGVTGSGKTELYLRAVAEVLRQKRQAIVLVPEIALTPQTIARFGARFGETIALQHSQLSLGERFDEWRRLRDGRAEVAIGSRSAIFAPVASPGLVVIDEEHEWTYKQEALPGYCFPHYHARDVAETLARLTGCTVLLGSATPSVESAYRAQSGAYRLLTMSGRVALQRRQRTATLRPLLQQRGVVPDSEPPDELAGGLPPVQVVDLRQELRAGNTSIFSRALQRAVETTLSAGEQAVLFLNRRGASTFVMCRDCGWVASCPRCDLSLTYHERSGVISSAPTSLVCHQCNRHAPVPTICPRCLSVRVKHFGVGTEQVETRARELFPGARIMRWDKDTASEKGAHERMLSRFAAGQADLLIGTQMIAKGLDLPLVTLVGVITADTAMHLPDFRAAERTFQLLTQVAGRAGRSFLGGRVILQTYTPLHYAIQAASRHDYHTFYTHEMAFRAEHAYPPLAPLIKLVYSASKAETAQAAAEELAGVLATHLAQLGLGATDLIGPAPAFFGRLWGRYRWQLLVRGPGAHELLLGLTLPPGWIVDVDPGSVL